LQGADTPHTIRKLLGAPSDLYDSSTPIPILSEEDRLERSAARRQLQGNQIPCVNWNSLNATGWNGTTYGDVGAVGSYFVYQNGTNVTICTTTTTSTTAT
jgi:hypothetical protein